MATVEQEKGTDPALLEALTEPAMYGESLPVVVHETHASWAFLAGEHAYKVKKPVRLAFLDYSTLSLRHVACLEEVRVNQEAHSQRCAARELVRTYRRAGKPDTVSKPVLSPGRSERYPVVRRRAGA